ncbi:hypothetical protein PoB_003679900 [Plakobranchus ocellatus]|uniref:Uncharacterized protein n=1 Tax=Plakobranchus ocellatus TaxID=259542 RepID=A0AAV4AR62_9GAST|nr:hypothetical protein PoB_003679900 [Plakobranchus ocellatus]
MIHLDMIDKNRFERLEHQKKRKPCEFDVGDRNLCLKIDCACLKIDCACLAVETNAKVSVGAAVRGGSKAREFNINQGIGLVRGQIHYANTYRYLVRGLQA